MTDKQLLDFIIYRAKVNGKQFDLSNPKAVIYCIGNGHLSFGIKFTNYPAVFLLRFVTANQRGIFKIKLDSPEFYDWKANLDLVNDYKIDTVPACVRHYVSYAIIEAIKSKDYGFDLFSFGFNNDISLIDPHETYEEIQIESDLFVV